MPRTGRARRTDGSRAERRSTRRSPHEPSRSLGSCRTDDDGEAVAAPVRLTFSPADWTVPRRVVLTGVDDPDRDGDRRDREEPHHRPTERPWCRGPASHRTSRRASRRCARAVRGGPGPASSHQSRLGFSHHVGCPACRMGTRRLNRPLCPRTLGLLRTTHHQPINAQCRLAHANGHALTFFATGAHTVIQRHVVAHH